MKNHLIPFAQKNKSKSIDDEKHFKLSEKVFEMYGESIDQLFKNIAT